MTIYALVTGAAGGIGRAIVQRLAKDGFPIIATDINEADAAEVVASLPGTGHKTFALNVTDEAKVQKLFEEVEINGAKIGMVVAAAGILLLADENAPEGALPDTAIARAVHATVRTVERIRELEERVARTEQEMAEMRQLLDRQRAGRATAP